ncbi:hypothetical protein ESA94_05710 [Lacibacter luteus]|uniref:DUF3157 family protein n=1 Tax=Lacibacter luteus TaxID=2508719 RepID=A0A4Q1CN58_9BACT|nr:hypothetical protein [Lacibacter luteus]RXK62496.1 hypothetical protein ESA94_05710 [Lacibacter luteus]
MKTTILFFAFLFSTVLLFAQQTATTKDGKTVILNDDGTWVYQTETNSSSKTQFNDSLLTKYSKSTAAKTLLKSERTDHALWYNETKWNPTDLKPTEASEYLLKLKNQDGYCITVVEKIEIPLENFSAIVVKSMKMRGAENVIVEKEEYRMVNGKRVLFMQFSVTMSGMNFTYAGYYFSNESGTSQVLCYTAKNLFKQYQQEFMTMLNGFVVIPQ